MDDSDEDKREVKAGARHVHRSLLELFGKFVWDQSFDPKAERSRDQAALSETDNQLSEQQLADLRGPGPIGSPERVAAVLAKFRI